MTALTVDRRVLTETEPHKFCTEASDLGLRPGEWPQTLHAPDLGNGLPLTLDHAEEKDGDLLWIDYRQSLGIIRLRVFND